MGTIHTWLAAGVGADPGLPRPLGRAAPPPLGGRGRRGGARSPSAAWLSPVRAASGAQADLTVPNSEGKSGDCGRQRWGPGTSGDWKRTGATLRRGAQTFQARAAGPPAPVVSPSQSGFFSFCHCEFAFSVRLGDIWPERTAQPRAVRSRVLTSVLQGAPQWLRGLSVAGRVPHSGGPRVAVLRVRWGLSWPSAGKREGGSQPGAWHPPGAISVYPGTARLGTARWRGSQLGLGGGSPSTVIRVEARGPSLRSRDEFIPTQTCPTSQPLLLVQEPPRKYFDTHELVCVCVCVSLSPV